MPKIKLSKGQLDQLRRCDVKTIAEAVTNAGARYLSYINLRLPLAVSPLFQAWLKAHYPGHAEKVLNRLRNMHGGEVYNARFGARMRGSGFHADSIEQAFAVACQRFGIEEHRANLNTKAFERPESVGDRSLLRGGFG